MHGPGHFHLHNLRKSYATSFRHRSLRYFPLRRFRSVRDLSLRRRGTSQGTEIPNRERSDLQLRFGIIYEGRANSSVLRGFLMGSAYSALITAVRNGGPGYAAALITRRLFLSWLSRRRELIIVQIGAHVGATGNDPLYGFLRKYLDPGAESFRPNWRAVLVEPVPEYFQTLRRNYAGLSNVAFEQAAIVGSDGPVVMRTLGCDPETHGIPDWATQLSSIVSDPAERAGLPDSIRDFWRAHGRDEVVQGFTLTTLMSRHGLREITLLQMDTEGADGNILESIDFDRVVPEFINFERINLGSQEPKIRSLLHRVGYRLLNWADDTFCFRAGAILGRMIRTPGAKRRRRVHGHPD